MLWMQMIASGILISSSMATMAGNITQPSYFGLHIHKADTGTAWPKVKFGSWRLWDSNVQWPQLEPEKDQWHFEQLDRYVAMAKLTNVSVLLPLGLSPRWASARNNEPASYGNGSAAEPRNLEDWRNYVRTVAQRYKGRITEYEIWNEPNDKGFFSGSTASLVELTCAAYAILKETDPGIKLVSPGYTGVQNLKLLDEFLAKGGSKCIDVVSYHLYVIPSPPEAMLPVVSHLQEVMRNRGVGNLPLWNGESGWAMANEDGTSDRGRPPSWENLNGHQMAAYVARALVLGRAAGLERFYWYSWDHTFMGLIEPTAKTFKPSASAYGAVIDWLTNREAPACAEAGDIWLCRIKPEADGERLIVWRTKSGQSTFTVPPGRTIASADRADLQAVKVLMPGQIGIDDVPTMIRLAH